MMLIFGANGPSGRALLERLNNKDTVAVLRKPAQDGFFAQHGFQTASADVLDAGACEAVIKQYCPDTVVSFVGGKNEQGIRSDATGNINIIEAAVRHVPTARFVFVTSMGCGEQWEGMSEPFKQALGEAVKAKTEAENVLRGTGLRWTILRPCGLGSGDSDAYRLHQNLNDIPRQYMNRNGLAAAVCEVLGDESSIGRVYSVTAE